MKCDKSGREASLNKKRVVTPNDPKLRDSGGLAWLLRGGLCGEQQA